MEPRISKILDECIRRVHSGETIEDCLARYDEFKAEIEPLLRMAMDVHDIPQVSLSEEELRTSRIRLISRIARDNTQDVMMPNPSLWAKFWYFLSTNKRIATPTTLIATSILIVAFLMASLFGSFSSSTIHAATCTLSIFKGDVYYQSVGSDVLRPGWDTMIIESGTQIKTGDNSYAILTFFEGSSLRLEPDTTIEIKEIVITDEQSSRIVVNQLVGMTWSSTAPMMNNESYYLIETPAASILAHGTLFLTSVGENGTTVVSTTEGLVSVKAQDQLVRINAMQQTTVEPGQSPSRPHTIPTPSSEFIISSIAPPVSSLTEPTGASTGFLVDGFSFNQIAGSRASLGTDGVQVITLVEPSRGEYLLTVRNTDGQNAKVTIQVANEGVTAFDEVIELPSSEDGWIISLDIQVELGVIVDFTINSIEPLSDEGPEKVVQTELANTRTVPIESATSTNIETEIMPGASSYSDTQYDNFGPYPNDNEDGINVTTTSGETEKR